ncbi:MAG: ABC transporter ATP-binding protein [Clostridiales bacterium]|nr:ABC transporter ATP-binding protein [Clostridiales bacterium]
MKIKLIDICKKYGKQEVLKSVSMEFSEGVYGLLGKNGAGKTTLIGILLGIIKANSGEILIDGKPVRSQSKEFLNKIGYLPQYPQFYKEMQVYEFLCYMAALKGLPKKETKNKVEWLIEEVNLTDAKKKKVGALSGGMRQRLGIAQAMLNEPEILILDEPTAGLDPQERIRFRNLISKFAKNRTVILVTHIVSDVEYIANQVIIMDEGDIACQGNIEELENSITGKVWEVTRNKGQDMDDLDFSNVSNLKREGDNTKVRVVSDTLPTKDAIITSVGLEDVFLYYCKGDKE